MSSERTTREPDEPAYRVGVMRRIILQGLLMTLAALTFLVLALTAGDHLVAVLQDGLRGLLH